MQMDNYKIVLIINALVNKGNVFFDRKYMCTGLARKYYIKTTGDTYITYVRTNKETENEETSREPA